jgi:hypothetical protein
MSFDIEESLLEDSAVKQAKVVNIAAHSTTGDTEAQWAIAIWLRTLQGEEVADATMVKKIRKRLLAEK